MSERTGIFVNGAWRDSASKVENRNPSDISDLIGAYSQASAADLDEALDAAKSAQPQWWAAGVQKRHDVLMAIGTELMARAEDIGLSGRSVLHLFRRGSLAAAWRSGRKRAPGYRNRRAPRTCRRCRDHQPLEFSGGNTCMEDCACAGIWQLRGIQARTGDTRHVTYSGATVRGIWWSSGRTEHGDGKNH